MDKAKYRLSIEADIKIPKESGGPTHQLAGQGSPGTGSGQSATCSLK